jgi:hypothetical protein
MYNFLGSKVVDHHLGLWILDVDHLKKLRNGSRDHILLVVDFGQDSSSKTDKLHFQIHDDPAIGLILVHQIFHCLLLYQFDLFLCHRLQGIFRLECKIKRFRSL